MIDCSSIRAQRSLAGPKKEVACGTAGHETSARETDCEVVAALSSG